MAKDSQKRGLLGADVGTEPHKDHCGLLIRRPQVRSLLGPQPLHITRDRSVLSRLHEREIQDPTCESLYRRSRSASGIFVGASDGPLGLGPVASVALGCAAGLAAIYLCALLGLIR